MHKREETHLGLRNGDIRTQVIARRGAITAVATAVAALIAPGVARSQQSVDDEDQGFGADRRRPVNDFRRGRPSRVTDSDQGEQGDPAGNGRGGAAQRRAGATDADPTADPVGNGRGPVRGRRSGLTDRDPTQDPPGDGRG